MFKVVINLFLYMCLYAFVRQSLAACMLYILLTVYTGTLHPFFFSCITHIIILSRKILPSYLIAFHLLKYFVLGKQIRLLVRNIWLVLHPICFSILRFHN